MTRVRLVKDSSKAKAKAKKKQKEGDRLFNTIKATVTRRMSTVDDIIKMLPKYATNKDPLFISIAELMHPASVISSDAPRNERIKEAVRSLGRELISNHGGTITKIRFWECEQITRVGFNEILYRIYSYKRRHGS
jgi:hypothetical protein